MNRVSFLVDGHNLYHSAKQASQDLGGATTLWLDLRSLLTSFLSVIGGGTQLEEIYYFSALAAHRDAYKPGVTTRHRAYIQAIQSTGVIVELGRFKPKYVYCRTCKMMNKHHEEKESDVAISTRLMELLHNDKCETAVLVTGDTDLAPAVRVAAVVFPAKQVCFAFPYRRRNTELAKLVGTSFKIKKERYVAHQFSDPLILPGGRALAKPVKW